MRRTARVFIAILMAGAPLAASAQGYGRAPARDVDVTGSVGPAPGQPAWRYDTGGDNDRRPDLPAYQQGGGMQTGGPARNLVPSDRFQIVPR